MGRATTEKLDKKKSARARAEDLRKKNLKSMRFPLHHQDFRRLYEVLYFVF